jgi:hypothetical protein
LTDICVEDNTDKRGVQLFLLVSSIQSSGRYIKSEWFIPYMQELIPLLEAGTYQKPYVDCSYIESLLFTARNNLQLKSRDFDMTSYLLHKEDAKNYTYGMVSPVGAEAKPRDFSKEPHPSPEDVEESVDDILAEIDESIKNKG